jgi:hypothetical protein
MAEPQTLFLGFAQNSNQKQWQSFIQRENIIERSKMREETCLPAGRDERREDTATTNYSNYAHTKTESHRDTENSNQFKNLFSNRIDRIKRIQ